MYKILVEDRTGKAGKPARKLRLLLRSAMKNLRLPSGEVSLLIVNDPFIRKLNYRYRHKNRPTDVLSFPQHDLRQVTGGDDGGRRSEASREERRAPEETGARYPTLHWGDIVISATTARKQARAAGKEIESEFAMLAVHGLLHLLGHDHAEPKEEKVMFGLQKKLLKKAGYV